MSAVVGAVALVLVSTAGTLLVFRLALWVFMSGAAAVRRGREEDS